MMTRPQRIEYEILECTLNRATHSEGYPSSVAAFTRRLQQYFSDISAQEFTEACKRLFQQGALAVGRLKNPVELDGRRDYRGDGDEDFFADARQGFYLRRTSLSRVYLGELADHIEAPLGFKPKNLNR